MSWLWERVKRKTSAEYRKHRKQFKILSRPFYEMEQLRRENKVDQLINLDDYEVTQRVGHVTFTYRDKVMVWGGYMTLPNRDGEVLYRHSKYWRTNWLMTYSPISQTWTPIYSNPKDCPPPVSSGAVGVHGDTMYAFCGFVILNHIEQEVPENSLADRLAKGGTLELLTIDESEFPEATNVNSVHALNLRTRQWKRLNPSGSPPFPCDKLSAFDYNGKTYLFGGYGPQPEANLRLQAPTTVTWIMERRSGEVINRGWNNMLVEFDPGAAGGDGSWKWVGGRSDIWPSPRAAHAMAVDIKGGYALLFGGRFGSERLNDLFLLKMDTMCWSLLLPSTDDETADSHYCPIGRSWHTLTSISDNTFLLYGGYSTNEQPLSDCWLIEFDPLLHETDCAWNSLRLTRLRSHEDPWFGVRFWHAAVKIPAEECVMVVGGYASHEPVNRPTTKHGDALLRLELSARSLFSLALDASCQFMEHRSINTLEVPKTIMEAIDKRMPKFIYERARKIVCQKNRVTS